MATDTTPKTEKAEAAEKSGESESEKAATTEPKVAPEETEQAAAQTPDHDVEDAGHEGSAGATAGPRNGGLLAGAAAVISAGFGVVALTGNSLGEMLRERKQLIGQIETANPAGGGGGDQMTALYAAPWHATALVNGVFAFLAVVAGALVLAAFAKREDTRPWMKALALGGIVLGAVGLVMAGGMYFDVLAPPPAIPGAPS